MTCDEARGKLVPYVDSELPAAELADFEAHLRGCASCAAGAVELLRTKFATRTAGMRYTLSPEFRMRLEQNIRAKQKPSWWSIRFPRFAVAAVAFVLVIASVVLWVNRSERERAFTEIADMHVTTMASANPVDVVSTDRHTVKPWFAGRLPFSFNLPELQNSEFALIGGRVTYFEHNPGAQLLFSLRKHQLSVFIFREEAGGLPSYSGRSTSTRLGLNIETWREGGLRYFIVSDVSASEVHKLGELMRVAARS